MNSTITYRILAELLEIMNTLLTRMSILYRKNTEDVDPIYDLLADICKKTTALESHVSGKLQEASDRGEETK